MHIGTAGWSIPKEVAAAFPGDGQHLQRYAQVMNCAEINTSAYRRHAPEVYARWAGMTPPDFRFAVKLPKAITHDARLRKARQPLQQFLAEVAGLGDKLAVLLVQLPPSFAYEARPVRNFFRLLAELHGGSVACEARHRSWFTPTTDRALAALRVTRVAADPAPVPGAARPGGWLGPQGDGAGALLYHRWHGSPRTYWSRYEADWLQQRADELNAWPAGTAHWCIFDNTAAGAALPNALVLRQQAAADSSQATRRQLSAACGGHRHLEI